jgi:hypothetical protein
MEFADGKTIKKVRSKELDEFLRIVADQQFQDALGRILAADAFCGNSDRMYAGYKDLSFTEPNLKGWHNGGNIVIRQGLPVAIDNGFNPKSYDKNAVPFGGRLELSSWSSIAPVFKTHAVKEAGLIFDHLLQSARDKHPQDTQSIDNIANQKTAFAANVSAAAVKASQALLAHGQHWKDMFTKMGAGNTIIEEFRKRKRMLRQVARGVDPQEAARRAENPDEYRKWLLMTEYGVKDTSEADDILQGGIQKYKQFKQKNPALPYV